MSFGALPGGNLPAVGKKRVAGAQADAAGALVFQEPQSHQAAGVVSRSRHHQRLGRSSEARCPEGRQGPHPFVPGHEGRKTSQELWSRGFEGRRAPPSPGEVCQIGAKPVSSVHRGDAPRQQRRDERAHQGDVPRFLVSSRVVQKEAPNLGSGETLRGAGPREGRHGGVPPQGGGDLFALPRGAGIHPHRSGASGEGWSYLLLERRIPREGKERFGEGGFQVHRAVLLGGDRHGPHPGQDPFSAQESHHFLQGLHPKKGVAVDPGGVRRVHDHAPLGAVGGELLIEIDRPVTDHLTALVQGQGGEALGAKVQTEKERGAREVRHLAALFLV
ncbi:MAG: hypothetical protein BWY88_00498 [Synergistetes bacterium ADurb.Bin520]|nr:MAG: hypothetical protein BWY88_00498 [Synergistetes bacterium ADurb.Bin520]